MQGNAQFTIPGLSPLNDVRPGDLCCVLEAKHLREAEASPAGALLLKMGWESKKPHILVPYDPRLALAKLLPRFNQRPVPPPGIASTAIIHPSAQVGKNVILQDYVVVGPAARLGDNVTLFPHVVVGAGAKVGAGSLIYAHVSLYDGVHIGDRVTLHAGCVIGADGFGFVPNEAKQYEKVPQIGTVVIEDDAEIGALTTIDRGAIGKTVIGRGVKIDNNVHIAHNCRIGHDTVIAACTGIAGSVTIGNRVTIAGDVGISGHLTIGDDATILGRSGVTKSIPAKSIVSGFPAQPHAQELACQAALRKQAKRAPI